MSESIDINDIITLNRNIYGTQQQNKESKILQKPADDSSLTIDNILKGNQAFYAPVSVKAEQINEKIAEESAEEKTDFFQEVQLLSKIPEITSLNSIYNYKTIFKNDGIPYDEVKIQIKQGSKEKKENRKAAKHLQQRKQLLLKSNMLDFIKLNLKIMFYHSKKFIIDQQTFGEQYKVGKTLKFTRFRRLKTIFVNSSRKTTGRFYIYDNKLGKVHIYSSDMLINDNKDKPLVSLNLNEDKPRQDPLLYLIECEHEYQWKSVLLVIGGHQLQRGEKKPLKTIKVFEIKRREVTLTPVLTITMTKSRMNPIVFDLIKDKGIIWQDKDNRDKEKFDPQHRSVDSKYIFLWVAILYWNMKKKQVKNQLKLIKHVNM